MTTYFGLLASTIAAAARGLRRAPVLALAVVATLAAGIGAATAIFSMMNVLLLRPMPGVHDVSSLASVERTGGQGIIDIFSYPDYQDLRAGAAGAIDLAAYRRAAVDVRSGSSERLTGALVTDNYFGVLGIRAAIGRTFTPADEHADVAVISDAAWTRLFQRDPAVLARPIVVNGHSFAVIGVLPPGFAGTFPGQFDSIWLTMGAQPVALRRMSAGIFTNRNSQWIQMVGRIAPGVSGEAATARVAAIGASLAQAFPATAHAGRLILVPGIGLASDDRADLSRFLDVLAVAAGLLLLVGCGNVANLLLVRAESRRREMATRRALGASSARLAAQVLTEGVLLTAAGSAAGLWLSPRVLTLVSTMSTSVYGVSPDAFVLDRRVVAFVSGLSAIVAIACTLVPLRHLWSGRLTEALSDGARGVAGRTSRLRPALVVAQVAFSVVLVVGAGLALRTMARIRAVDPGYSTSGIVLASYALDLHGYSPARAASFFDTLAASLGREPGMEAASWASAVPPVPFGGRRSVFHVGEAPPQPELQRREEELGVRADLVQAGPSFLTAMGVRVTRGRDFDERDRPGAQAVAIVNEALAARLWPGEDALGRYLEAPPYAGDVPPPMQVVAVVPDTRHRSLLGDRPVPVLYLPFLQNPDTRATLLLRTRAQAGGLEPRLRDATAALDDSVAVTSIQDVSQYVAATLWQQRAALDAFGVFAAFALFLAAMGVYAVVSHGVATRTREMGIRLALGASARRVGGLVVSESLRTSVVGVLAGLAIAASASGRMRAVLFGVDPHDVLTFAAAPIVLLVVAAAAAALPARRAARSNPIAALRQD